MNYGLGGLPIKYNADNRVEQEYKNKGKLHEYQFYKRNKRSIIQEVIKKTSGTHFHISFAWDIINPTLLSDKEFNQTKFKNTTSSIIKLLDRSEQSLTYTKGEKWDIILDRFEDQEQKNIDNGIALFKESKRTQNLATPYNSLYYGVTLQDNLLQFTDIIVGTIRSMIQSCVKDQVPTYQTSQDCAHIIPKILGYPNEIARLGMAGPPQYQEKVINEMKNIVNLHPNLGGLLE